MFDKLSESQRNQHIEVCRYFFRANVMKKKLEELIFAQGGVEEAVTTEWDEFWAYYCYWLSGLWVACEGIERIKFGNSDFISFAKSSMSLLHPIRQATFHFKPSTVQMSRHFDGDTEWAAVHEIHDRIMIEVGRFIETLPESYLEKMDRSD